MYLYDVEEFTLLLNAETCSFFWPAMLWHCGIARAAKEQGLLALINLLVCAVDLKGHVKDKALKAVIPLSEYKGCYRSAFNGHKASHATSG